MAVTRIWDADNGTWHLVGGTLPVAGEDATDHSTLANLTVGDPHTQYALESSVWAFAFPVGAIYLSIDPANPGTFFGGTWVAFATGRMLVGHDPAQTEFDTVMETGGSKLMADHTHSIGTHTHTNPNTASDTHGHSLPHTHNVPSAGTSAATSTPALNVSAGSPFTAANQAHQHNTISVATGAASDSSTTTDAHAHTQGATGANVAEDTAAPTGTNPSQLNPYIVVYMWRRTA